LLDAVNDLNLGKHESSWTEEILSEGSTAIIALLVSKTPRLKTLVLSQSQGGMKYLTYYASHLRSPQPNVSADGFSCLEVLNLGDVMGVDLLSMASFLRIFSLIFFEAKFGGGVLSSEQSWAKQRLPQACINVSTLKLWWSYVDEASFNLLSTTYKQLEYFTFQPTARHNIELDELFFLALRVHKYHLRELEVDYSMFDDVEIVSALGGFSKLKIVTIDLYTAMNIRFLPDTIEHLRITGRDHTCYSFIDIVIANLQNASML
jgi:hypothetical protein